MSSLIYQEEHVDKLTNLAKQVQDNLNKWISDETNNGEELHKLIPLKCYFCKEELYYSKDAKCPVKKVSDNSEHCICEDDSHIKWLFENVD